MSLRELEPTLWGDSQVRRAPCLEAVMSAAQAMDRALAGAVCLLVRADDKPLPIGRWQGDATAADLELFSERCHGPTLDVGCGPGRLTAALTDRGLEALGIDISSEAVRQTRARGAAALRVDVFDDLPGGRIWEHVLLADGNVGMGGDPVRLLRRVADLLAPGGSVLVELAGTTRSVIHEQVRLRVGDDLSAAFNWATVGAGAINDLADAAGLDVGRVRYSAGRPVATVRHLAGGPRPEGMARWQ